MLVASVCLIVCTVLSMMLKRDTVSDLTQEEIKHYLETERKINKTNKHTKEERQASNISIKSNLKI